MNKRIEELIEKSGAGDVVPEGMHNYLKEFAELLIKECCDIFIELRTRPADLVAKDVKLHFGIKE